MSSHRSILSQGPYTLHMWSYPDLEDGAVTYQADKLSTASNSDIADSMAISFLLDRYSFPVVLPNSFSPSESSDSPDPPSSNTDSLSQPTKPTQGPLADDVFLKQPSTHVNTNSDCLRRFREENIQYSVNLPQYLRTVDWMNHRAVEDVHWLLGNFNPEELDLTVALELLSMDFPDMMVRRLAVQRLEHLSNDDVLKYLLQLVQVFVCILRSSKGLCCGVEKKCTFLAS